MGLDYANFYGKGQPLVPAACAHSPKCYQTCMVSGLGCKATRPSVEAAATPAPESRAQLEERHRLNLRRIILREMQTEAAQDLALALAEHDEGAEEDAREKLNALNTLIYHVTQ